MQIIEKELAMSKTNGTKRTVLYARVSTDEQAKKYSLGSQLEGCRKYAADNGFAVVEELSESVSGAVPIRDRVDGARLYTLVDAAAVDAVILYTHDRTTRDDRALEYLLFKSYLHERGIELHYADKGIDQWDLASNIVGFVNANYAT